MKRLANVLIGLSAVLVLLTSCEKNRIENKCCTGEYEIITTKYVTPDSFDLFIPQAFTPDGDGKNDYFTPLGRGYKIEEMVIKRNRKVVFEYSQHVEPFWDGSNQKDGSYDYFLTLRLSNGDPIEVEGSVCIIRPGVVDDRNYDFKREKICTCLMPDMIDNKRGSIYDSRECPEGSSYAPNTSEE